MNPHYPQSYNQVSEAVPFLMTDLAEKGIDIVHLEPTYPGCIEDEVRSFMSEPESNEEFKIETGIPIPPIHSPKSLSNLFVTLEKLSVGESFFIPSETPGKVSPYVQAVAHRRLPDRKFITRSYKAPSEPTGCRVWRYQ